MGPRADLGDVRKRKFLTLSGLELRPLDHLARRTLTQLLMYSHLSHKKTPISDLSSENIVTCQRVDGLCGGGTRVCNPPLSANSVNETSAQAR
jgi:hypothetical protein